MLGSTSLRNNFSWGGGTSQIVVPWGKLQNVTRIYTHGHRVAPKGYISGFIGCLQEVTGRLDTVSIQTTTHRPIFNFKLSGLTAQLSSSLLSCRTGTKGERDISYGFQAVLKRSAFGVGAPARHHPLFIFFSPFNVCFQDTQAQVFTVPFGITSSEIPRKLHNPRVFFFYLVKWKIPPILNDHCEH